MEPKPSAFYDFTKELHGFLNKPLTIANSRGVQLNGDSLCSGITPVYVDFNYVDGDPVKPSEPFDGVLTPEDMIRLAQEYGAEFYLDDDGMRDDTIFVADEQAKLILQPLAGFSRKYLCNIGIPNTEIDAILNDLGLDDSALIILVTALVSAQEARDCEPLTHQGIKNLFVTPAYADSGGNMAWNCAMKAIGINDAIAILETLRDGASTELTIRAVKRFLKLSARKFFGYVGAAVMLIEFSDCLAHYNRYF